MPTHALKHREPLPAPTSGNPAATSPDSAPLPWIWHLLVVDDDPSVRLLLTTFLRRHGFAVITANDGQQALRMLAHHPVHAIVMDLDMPLLDGLATTRTIRRWGDHWGSLPIVAFSARSSEADHRASLEAGCSRHLVKGCPLGLLTETLNRLLHPTPLE